jgi:hypothetical protein
VTPDEALAIYDAWLTEDTRKKAANLATRGGDSYHDEQQDMLDRVNARPPEQVAIYRADIEAEEAEEEAKERAEKFNPHAGPAHAGSPRSSLDDFHLMPMDPEQTYSLQVAIESHDAESDWHGNLVPPKFNRSN